MNHERWISRTVRFYRLLLGLHINRYLRLASKRKHDDRQNRNHGLGKHSLFPPVRFCVISPRRFKVCYQHAQINSVGGINYHRIFYRAIKMAYGLGKKSIRLQLHQEGFIFFLGAGFLFLHPVEIGAHGLDSGFAKSVPRHGIKYPVLFIDMGS